MAEKIAAIQPPDGFWRTSLLDPDSYPAPETSGTAFHCYGLAWGINNGYLKRENYSAAVAKAWTGLIHSVRADGKLGSVQPVGASPNAVTSNLTETYGVGAFLLAGTEVYKLSLALCR